MRISITPDKEKAKAILKSAQTSLKVIEYMPKEFATDITKKYYEIIRELITIIILLDGYKFKGEGAHREQIEYSQKYFKYEDIVLIDKLRIIRNKIAYDGFYVKTDFLKQKEQSFQKIIPKLNQIIKSKLYK